MYEPPAMPGQPCTPDEYLTFERAMESRQEYVDGRITEREWANRSHATMSANLIGVCGQDDDGDLTMTKYTWAGAVIELPSVGCSLPLAEIYDGVRFPEPAEPEA